MMLGSGRYLLLSVERSTRKGKKKHPHPQDGAEDAGDTSWIHR